MEKYPEKVKFSGYFCKKVVDLLAFFGYNTVA